MALTRKFLVALGIEESKIDEIITAHTDVTDALKKERDEYKDSADKLKEAQKELAYANTKLKEFEEAHKDTLKEKYNELVKNNKQLQKDFDEYKQSVNDKEVLNQKKEAFKQMLKEIGISEKRIDAVMKVSDISNIEFDNDGKIKDSDTLKDSLKNEWADFIVEQSEKGADTPKPPRNDGTGMSGASRASQLALEHHKNLYGAIKED